MKRSWSWLGSTFFMVSQAFFLVGSPALYSDSYSMDDKAHKEKQTGSSDKSMSEGSANHCCGGYHDPKFTPWTIEIRGAAFIPLKDQLSDVYGTALPALELQSTYRLAGNLWQQGDQLLLWENVGWVTKTGKSIGFGYNSELNLIPFSAGLDYQVHCVEGLDFYIGLGLTYSLLRIENYDGFETTHMNRNAFGFTTKTGFMYTFCRNFFVDVYADYFFTPFGEMDHDPIQPIENDFSAFFVGGGVGFKF